MFPDPRERYCQCGISSEFCGIKLQHDSLGMLDVKESCETDRQTDRHRWEGLEQTVSSSCAEALILLLFQFTSSFHQNFFTFSLKCLLYFLGSYSFFRFFSWSFLPSFVLPLSLNNSCLLFEVGFFLSFFFFEVSATYLFIFVLLIFFVRLLPCLL